MQIKSKYMNYFKGGKLFQWDENRIIQTITKLEDTFPQDLEFCLAKKDMDKFLKYNNPKITLGNQLKISSGRQWTNLPIVETTLTIPAMDWTGEVNVDIDKLKVATKFTATNEKKPILTGVNIGVNQIAATDAFFSYRTIVDNEVGGVTLTKEFINEIEEEGIINIKYNSKTSCYIGKDIIIFGRLLEGAYPSLDKIYAHSDYHSFTLNATDLNNLLQFSDNDELEVLQISNGKLKLISGNSTSELEADIQLDTTIYLSTKKLSIAIKYCIGEEITFEYISNVRPLFLNGDILLLPIKYEQ